MDKQPSILDISFSKSFETALNLAIHLDEMQGAAFDALDSKVVELWIAPSKTPLFCIINQRQIVTQTTLDGEADVTLKTGMRQLMALTQGQGFENKFIRGSESIGQAFIEAMENLEIDWEEHLSHYTGDLVAFKIGHGVRSVLESKQQTKSYMGETIKEYLQFEINALPARHQVEHFIEDVKQTQQQVDQLAERIASLANATSHSA